MHLSDLGMPIYFTTVSIFGFGSILYDAYTCGDPFDCAAGCKHLPTCGFADPDNLGPVAYAKSMYVKQELNVVQTPDETTIEKKSHMIIRVFRFIRKQSAGHGLAAARYRRDNCRCKHTIKGCVDNIVIYSPPEGREYRHWKLVQWGDKPHYQCPETHQLTPAIETVTTRQKLKSGRVKMLNVTPKTQEKEDTPASSLAL